jgi:hypothetical protein
MIRHIFIVYGGAKTGKSTLERLMRYSFIGHSKFYTFDDVHVKTRLEYALFVNNFELRLRIESDKKYEARTDDDAYPVIFTNIEEEFAKKLGIALQRRYSNPKGEKIPVSLMHISALVDDLQ